MEARGHVCCCQLAVESNQALHFSGLTLHKRAETQGLQREGLLLAQRMHASRIAPLLHHPSSTHIPCLGLEVLLGVVHMSSGSAMVAHTTLAFPPRGSGFHAKVWHSLHGRGMYM